MVELSECTLDDLIKDAAKAGQPMTRRVLTEWIQLGLLNHPTRRGKGRARGSHPATVTANQRQLFDALLHHRANVKRLATLAAIPVYLWVYWGDDYVPLRQTRRALGTWLDKSRQPAKPYAKQASQDVVDFLAHPDATTANRRTLLQLLTQATYTGRINNQRQLEAVLQKVFDPHQEDRRVGPPGLNINADEWLNATLLRHQGIVAFLNDRVSDVTFEQARDQLRQTLREYQVLSTSRLALPASVIIQKAQDDRTDIMNGVCQHLFLAVGFVLNRECEAKS